MGAETFGAGLRIIVASGQIAAIGIQATYPVERERVSQDEDPVSRPDFRDRASASLTARLQADADRDQLNIFGVTASGRHT